MLCLTVLCTAYSCINQLKHLIKQTEENNMKTKKI